MTLCVMISIIELERGYGRNLTTNRNKLYVWMNGCKLIYRKNCIARNICLDHNIKTNKEIPGKINYKKTFSALKVKLK